MFVEDKTLSNDSFTNATRGTATQDESEASISFPSTSSDIYDEGRQCVDTIIDCYFGPSLELRRDRQWREIIEWLLPPVHACVFQQLVHSDLQNKHDPITGHWFTSGSALRRWISGVDPLMWLCGNRRVRSHFVRSLADSSSS